MALTERLTEDYQDWTESAGTWAVTNNVSAKAESAEDYNSRTFTIEKEFVIAAAARGTAPLTVEAELYLSNEDAQQGGAMGAGAMQCQVILVDADSAEHTLFDRSTGTGILEVVLDEEDLAAYITKAGTYTLKLKAVVKSQREVTAGGDYFYHSYVTFRNLSLWVNDTVVDYELTMTDGAACDLLSERWDVDGEGDPAKTELESITGTAQPIVETVAIGATLNEPLDIVEHFTIGKTTPYAATDEKLLCSKTDSKVYEFEQGTPTGRFDTKDEDFGLSGQDKTLEKVTFESPAEAPHTVNVYVSIDSGLTWILCGQKTISLGTAGVVDVWITAEKFSISFRGDGLQLSAFSLYAIPRGPEAPVEG